MLSREIIYEEAQILELLKNKEFKLAILNIFKELKEIMPK